MADRMIFLGEKETFIIRVLVNKVAAMGVQCEFVPWTVNEINAHIKDAGLVALCFDGGAPKEDALHFLCDSMKEADIRMFAVGDMQDLDYINSKVPKELIHKSFERPVDNEEFAENARDYLNKVSSGEFKKSILIVDDDPQYLSLIREWLKDKFKVTMANSGLQAIKWLGNNKADLILLDHEMPVTSGPKVLEMLRSDPETASIPVIFLTGKGDKESVMSVVSLRPEGYFLKTIQKDELILKLEEFFVLHS